MPSKTTKLAQGALLGAAAAALTVKGTLSGPLGAVAEAPLNDAKQGLAVTSRTAAGQVEQGVAQALSPAAPSPRTASRGGLARGPAPSRAPTSTSPSQAGGPTLWDLPRHGNRPYTQSVVRRILHDAARRHGLDPKLVLALAYWESGWDQSKVSPAGAIGLMQVEPDTAAEAGPALLGREVDLTDPYDNADVGAAIFREYLDAFGSPAQALAAYNQGPTSLRANGMFPDTEVYVQGILDLASRMSG